MDVRTLFMKKQNLTIGFIGQGWVGRHYADAFEQSGFITVRYGLEPQYVVLVWRAALLLKNQKKLFLKVAGRLGERQLRQHPRQL